jgi:hypothetical protein
MEERERSGFQPSLKLQQGDTTQTQTDASPRLTSDLTEHSQPGAAPELLTMDRWVWVRVRVCERGDGRDTMCVVQGFQCWRRGDENLVCDKCVCVHLELWDKKLSFLLCACGYEGECVMVALVSCFFFD